MVRPEPGVGGPSCVLLGGAHLRARAGEAPSRCRGARASCRGPTATPCLQPRGLAPTRALGEAGMAVSARARAHACA
eukprot:7271570-Alexandrium_andersonii.AAC.1